MNNQHTPGETPQFSTELLASVSHEMRSPLTSIKGYAETLLRHEQRLAPAERHEFLLAIDDASNRLMLIIDRFFELSQLEAGTLPLVPNTIPMVPLVREAMHAIPQRCQGLSEPSAQADTACALHLEYSSVYADEEEPLMLGDRRRVREALDYVLENAVLYSPDTCTIDITVRPLTLVRDAQEFRKQLHAALLPQYGPSLFHAAQLNLPGIEIAIDDHGIGIADDHLAAIFERFYRVDTRLAREVNGLGLGLTMCKYIVEQHGGQIWVESQVDQGSVFHLWFPLYTPTEKEKLCQ